jgi:thiol-disulfide isomerase/thioredoxin
MHRSFWKNNIHPAVVFAIVGAGVGAVFFVFLRPAGQTADPAPGPAVRAGRAALPAGTYPEAPLSPGTPAPPLEAAGWVNGPPPRPGAARLIVLDIWAGWCPACQLTAPGVVRLHQKYKDRGVAFVSLTDQGADAVRAFADRFGAGWACGYGTPLEAVARFGAYSGELMTESYNPGYEVHPTFFVLGPDGHVVWHDDQARPRHLKTPGAVVRDLEAAIERQLASGPPS